MRKYSIISALVFLMSVAAGNAASAQTWGTDARVSRNAQQLAEQAYRFQQVVENTRGYSSLADQTNDFIRSATRFQRMVERNPGWDRLLDNYYQLESDYRDLRQAVFRAERARENRPLRRYWLEVVTAHERLSLAMAAHGFVPHRQYRRNWRNQRDYRPSPYYQQ